MRMGRFALMLPLSATLVAGVSLSAQSTAGNLSGTVTDPSGAAVPGATVTIANPVSGLSRTITSDSAGRYSFTNLPFNRYHVEVTASGFSPTTGDVQIRTGNAAELNLKIDVGAAA